MASAFSRAVAALSIGTCFYRPQIPKCVWVAGAVCSVLPDIDAVGFRFGIHYGDFWGHRGFTHSLVFAALLSGVAAMMLIRHGMPQLVASHCSRTCFS
jgi:inner membrane protein